RYLRGSFMRLHRNVVVGTSRTFGAIDEESARGLRKEAAPIRDPYHEAIRKISEPLKILLLPYYLARAVGESIGAHLRYNPEARRAGKANAMADKEDESAAAPVNTSLEPYRFLDRLFHEAGQNWGALQAILYTLRHQFTDPEAIKKIQNLEVSITKGLERPHREVKRAWTLSVEGSRGDETSLKKLANDKEGLQDLVEQCRIIEHSFA